MTDLYKSMSELTRKEKEWLIETQDRNSDVIVTAIHGGGIEAGTTELALLTAELSNTNYFGFKGLKSSNNSQLHVTSTNYDVVSLLSWNQKMNRTISLHGYADSNKSNSYIGGLDKELIRLITENLKKEGFNIEQAPQNLAGTEPNNITNKNNIGAGVQIELSTLQRKELFNNKDFGKNSREDKNNWSENMYLYANAINDAIEKCERH